VLLCIAFFRVDMAALRSQLKRPALPLAATAWTMLAIPTISGTACLAIGLETRAPDLFLGLMMQALAPPMMAAPAFAALMGLDATLVLVTLVFSSLVAPITALVFATIFVGPALALSPIALGLKLFAILAGAALLATALRRVVGTSTVTRYKDEIDGINLIVVFVFVAAVMEHLAERLYAAPLAVLALGALTFAITFAVLGLTALAFARAGAQRALALGLMASQGNMGLMLAAAGGVLPDPVWIYFALSQFPIYLSPQLLKPLARRLADRASAVAR
jgi:BASS family bile acid:Na+ symporter